MWICSAFSVDVIFPLNFQTEPSLILATPAKITKTTAAATATATARTIMSYIPRCCSGV
jgi:hypothetical protein